VGFITEFQQARESIAFPLVHRIKQKPTTKDLNILLEFSFSMFSKGNVEATKEARFARLVAGREAQNTANTVQERLEYADLYQTATFLLAPYDVDCFWIALEWGRPYEKAFYLPRRKQLLPIIVGYQEMLDDKIDVLTISQPTGTGKSTLMIGFNCLLAGRFPDKSKMMSAYGDGLCQSFYNGMLSFVQDDQEYNFKKIFPDVIEINTNAKKYEIDVNKKGRYPTLSAASIGGGFVGRTRAQQLITMDDMVKDIEEATNEDRLEKLRTRVTVDLFGRMEGACKILCQGTRYSIRDVIGMVQDMYTDKKERIRIIEIPALNDKNESNFEFDCDNRYTTAWYLQRKSVMSEADFMTTMQQIPIEREGMLFAEGELMRFKNLPIDYEPDMVVAAVDTSIDGADYFSMPIAKVYGNEVYIVDVLYSNARTDVTIPLCVDLLLKHGVSRVFFESNAAGKPLAKTIQDKVAERHGNCSFTVKPSISSKSNRIWGQYLNIRENFYFLESSEYEPQSQYWTFMRDLHRYTHNGKNKHDDAPDSLAMLSTFLKTSSPAKVEVLRRTW